MLLHPYEQQQAAQAIRALIVASGIMATVLRSAPGENLYGNEDATYTPIGTIPIELMPMPPDKLTSTIDATASVLPEADVHPEDHLHIASVTYRIQTLAPVHCFGVITHQSIQLVKHYGRATNR